MKQLFSIGLALVVGFFIGSCVFHYIDAHPNEELASKIEWSVVQAVEWQYRDKPEVGIKIVKINGYSLVGVPVLNGGGKIWIMLNPQNPPYYKQLPACNYTLSKDDLKLILALKIVNSTVENCLESHVEVSTNK